MEKKIRQATNLSEQLFEAFCRNRRVSYRRLREGPGKTPDYEIVISGQRIVVEVKQIDATPNGEISLRPAESHFLIIGKGVPGEPVRRKISNADRQLRELARDKFPSLLVLYDNTPSGGYTAPHEVSAAMYGQQTFVCGLFGRGVPEVQEWRFGGKRKMTAEMNTTISAVAAIFGDISEPELPPSLIVYHNAFAKVPLAPELFVSIDTQQFKLPEQPEGKYQGWQQIDPGCR